MRETLETELAAAITAASDEYDRATDGQWPTDDARGAYVNADPDVCAIRDALDAL